MAKYGYKIAVRKSTLFLEFFAICRFFAYFFTKILQLIILVMHKKRLCIAACLPIKRKSHHSPQPYYSEERKVKKLGQRFLHFATLLSK